MSLLKEKLNQTLPALSATLKEKNRLALPRLSQVVVATGVGKIKDKKRLEFIAGRLAKITGQKASPRAAKKSIAGFKSRQGETVGMMVTLRGARMYGFLDKLLAVVIPRIRDFRGFARTGIDEMGNLTVGLREHTIFPETADEELKDVFGLSITIVTTARNREEALAFFHALGFPFKPV
jgi:large subunit ribosomal protein L5